jgi:hypothetical protein
MRSARVLACRHCYSTRTRRSPWRSACVFTPLEPPELRERCQALAARLRQAADRDPAGLHDPAAPHDPAGAARPA